MWRGIWAESDKTRQSERSRIIAPALQQAVESAVAEIETASFSQAFMFDIEETKHHPHPPQGPQPQMQTPEAMMGMGGGLICLCRRWAASQPTQAESIAVRDQLQGSGAS